jgi:diguanylate cyclase (GGDEF)-like protein
VWLPGGPRALARLAQVRSGSAEHKVVDLLQVSGPFTADEGVVEDALHLRGRTVPIGVGVTYATVAALAAWVAVTWSAPHRGLIVALLALAVLTATVIALLPTQRILRTRWREPFFLAWSMSYVGFITVMAAADGGARSPTTLVFFLTLVFSSLSYPLWMVGVVSVSSVSAFVGLAIVEPIHHASSAVSPASIWVFAAVLGLVALMCIWQARVNARQHHRLGRLSRTDPLTGSLNRFAFSERLEAELRRVNAGEQAAVSLVVLDLVGFKAVNDTLGHPAGDELLIWTASALHQLVRPADAVARLGGDEFALILPGAPLMAALDVAERIRGALAARVQSTPGTAAAPADGRDIETLVRIADARLYARRATVNATVSER